jgi:predicted small metal-binding protein
MSDKDQKQEEEYLRDLAPHLHEMKHRETRIPEGYFESLEGRVMARIHSGTEEGKGKVVPLLNFRKLAIAAGLAVILALVPVIKKMFTENTPPATSSHFAMANFSDEEVMAYLEEDLPSDDLLYEELPVEDLEIGGFQEDLSDDDIINYLLEEDLSENLILEAL